MPPESRYHIVLFRLFRKNRNLFRTILEAGILRLECHRGQVLVRALFRTVDYRLLTFQHILPWWWVDYGSRLPCDSYMGIYVIHGGSTLMTSSNPNYLPKAPPINSITLGFQHMNSLINEYIF